MFYLLGQMFWYMLITLLLGVFLGWLLWRKGYAHDLFRYFGIETAGDAPTGDAGDGNGASLVALKEENARLGSELSQANAERSRLQNDLDECRAKSKGSKAPASVAAAVASVGSPSAVGTKPAGLTAARGGKADKLQDIKGIGPKLEKMLHGMGFYHFDQIAAWGPSELAWVDENLEGFKGRASRDEWVSQAKKLA